MAEQQEGKNKRQRRIYSTQIINQLIMDKDQGYDIDFEPFFQRDSNLRAANIPFKMTEEEMEEYQNSFHLSLKSIASLDLMYQIRRPVIKEA